MSKKDEWAIDKTFASKAMQMIAKAVVVCRVPSDVPNQRTSKREP